MRLNYGRTGCTGLWFDGVDLAQTFEIVEVDAPLLPDLQALTQELAQRPGAYFSALKIGTRTVKVKVRLDAESRDPMDIMQALRSVNGLLYRQEPKQLRLNEGLYLNAMLVGQTQIEDEAYYGMVELEFCCFDPYFYGAEHSVPITSGAVQTFEVEGAVEAWPTLQLTAISTSVRIQNSDTGEYVLIPDTTSGASITVDMGKQICMKGTAYAPYDLASDFFSVSGTARVYVTGADGTLKYVERYI